MNAGTNHVVTVLVAVIGAMTVNCLPVRVGVVNIICVAISHLKMKYSSFYSTTLIIFVHHEIIDLELVDCSKYYLHANDHADVIEAGQYEKYDYVYLGLKSYVNCVQAQAVKMQSKIVEDSKMMKKMQAQIEKLTKGNISMAIAYFKLHNY